MGVTPDGIDLEFARDYQEALRVGSELPRRKEGYSRAAGARRLVPGLLFVRLNPVLVPIDTAVFGFHLERLVRRYRTRRQGSLARRLDGKCAGVSRPRCRFLLCYCVHGEGSVREVRSSGHRGEHL
jgi:hypothetical protein